MSSREVALVEGRERVIPFSGETVERVPSMARPPVVQARPVTEKLPRKKPRGRVVPLQ